MMWVNKLLIIASLILFSSSRKNRLFRKFNICDAIVKNLNYEEEQKAHHENFLGVSEKDQNVDSEQSKIKDYPMKFGICNDIIKLLKKDLPELNKKQDDELLGLSLIGKLHKKTSKKSSSNDE